MNLYLVELRGCNKEYTFPNLSPAYVVAKDANGAYELVRKWADLRNYGFVDDRILKSIKLLAVYVGDSEYVSHPAPLFIGK